MKVLKQRPGPSLSRRASGRAISKSLRRPGCGSCGGDETTTCFAPHGVYRLTPALRLVAIFGVAWGAASCQLHDFSSRPAEGEIRFLDDLFAVAAIDDRRAVAVGDHGSVYWTRDGGHSWSAGKTATSYSLYSISMADANVGWAVGQLGTIIRTEDGGETWEVQPGPERIAAFHLLGVHAVDTETAWAVGVWGTRISTDDGGATWIDHSVPVTHDHPTFVWLSTEDQERIRNGESVYEDIALSSVFCLSRPSEKCWIVGEFGTILDSANLGKTWARREVAGEVRAETIGPDNDRTAMQNPYLFTVRFADDRSGLISGLGGVILRSTDGGLSWHRASTGSRRAVFSVASAADRSVAIGEKGLALFSIDGGETWKELSGDRFPAIFGFMRDLDFDRSRSVGYIVGQEGMILRSDDSGRSWTRVPSLPRATARVAPVREPSQAPAGEPSGESRAMATARASRNWPIVAPYRERQAAHPGSGPWLPTSSEWGHLNTLATSRAHLQRPILREGGS
jgi:photosystem II stability/assembly factor-like uncharacterized protein